MVCGIEKNKLKGFMDNNLIIHIGNSMMIFEKSVIDFQCKGIKVQAIYRN
ncbi:hypothetical protein [Clostridium saccharoperbutylacetonicum]